MNIEADFEQLDIGEEPIFERNVIKRTSTNHFKDKMSHLQVKPRMMVSDDQTSLSLLEPSKQLRAKSSVPTLDRTTMRGPFDQ